MYYLDDDDGFLTLMLPKATLIADITGKEPYEIRDPSAINEDIVSDEEMFQAVLKIMALGTLAVLAYRHVMNIMTVDRPTFRREVFHVVQCYYHDDLVHFEKAKRRRKLSRKL